MTFDKSVVVPLDPDATFALVTARKQGGERYYRLDERGVQQLRALFDSFWSDELDRLVADANKPQKETPP